MTGGEIGKRIGDGDAGLFEHVRTRNWPGRRRVNRLGLWLNHGDLGGRRRRQRVLREGRTQAKAQPNRRAGR